MHHRSWFVALLLLTGLGAVQAAETNSAAPAVVSTEGFRQKFTWGADVRVREELFNHIPVKTDPPGEARGGYNNYIRYRLRLWGQVDAADWLSLRGRFTDEFRTYFAPVNHRQDFPDEVVVDNLYADLKGLFNERVNVRLGLQDMFYGNGRVIGDGTPKDGSRTYYFCAARSMINLTANGKTTLDIAGIYDPPQPVLAIASQDREVVGINSKQNRQTESGFMAYLMDKHIAMLPAEAYYVFKHEGQWDNGDVRETGRHVHTLGIRIAPTNGPFDGNLELAGQLGKTDAGADLGAYMVDAMVRARLTEEGAWGEPRLGIGCYLLSGDDDTTDGQDTGWNPLWSRWPQYSELYVYAWDVDGAGYWSNLGMPYVNFSIRPAKWLSFVGMVGYMTADVANGSGGGTHRGMLYTGRLDFDILKNIGGRKGHDLFGHLLAEALDPGDYYTNTDMAYFLRWQLDYRF